MTFVEIVLAIVAILGVLLAYQAHHNGLSISAEAKADLATAKADVTTGIHALEVDVATLKAKVEGLISKPTPTVAPAPAPAPTPTPPAA